MSGEQHPTDEGYGNPAGLERTKRVCVVLPDGGGSNCEPIVDIQEATDLEHSRDARVEDGDDEGKEQAGGMRLLDRRMKMVV